MIAAIVAAADYFCYAISADATYAADTPCHAAYAKALRRYAYATDAMPQRCCYIIFSPLLDAAALMHFTRLLFDITRQRHSH